MASIFFDSSNAGKTAYPIGGQTNRTHVRTQPDINSPILATAELPAPLGTLTGNWSQGPDDVWRELVTPSGIKGWTRRDVMRVTDSTNVLTMDTSSQPQEAGSNGWMIFALACAAGYAAFKPKGKKRR